MQGTTIKTTHSEDPQPKGPIEGNSAALADPSHNEVPAENQLSHGRLVLLVIGLGLSVSCVSLDNTILSTAVPKISQQFETIEDVGWYGSTYFLAICSVNLLFGRLYTFYSTKWVYLAAMAMFELGSLICGVTPTSPGLIIGRAIAGMGSGGILPGAILMIAQNVPLHRRAFFNALIMGMASIAGVLGPLVGGALTEHATWRWCFYINLPVGVITVLAVVLFFRDPPISRDQGLSHREKIESLDLLGVSFFIPAICCLVMAIEWGGSKYAWNSARIIVLLILCIILFLIWAYVQFRKQEKSTIPPRLIVQRNVWASGAYASFLTGATYGMAYYVSTNTTRNPHSQRKPTLSIMLKIITDADDTTQFPIWLQAVKGASPTKSGIMNVPMIIGITVCSLLTGALVNGIGYYTPIMAIGSIVLMVGCGMCTTLEPTSGHPKWIGYQALVGMGAGIGFNLPLIAVQTALSKDDVATGTAIIIFGQNFSSTLFIAVAQNLFQSLLVTGVKRFAPSIEPQEVVTAGAADLPKHFPRIVLPSLKLAYNFAVTGPYYLFLAGSGLSLFCLAFLQCLSVKRVQRGTS